MNAKLMAYFNKRPRIAAFGTTDQEGKVNVVVLGSPEMTDEKTVVLLLRNSRTFANLKGNPHAALTIIEPGKTLPEWKGVRVYLKMIDYQTSGEKLEARRAKAAMTLGEERARLIHAVVTMEISDLKPLDDVGQGWEASI